ncbi:MAG: hypothetical protein ACRDNE_02210 [Gaiellaceae bacterium]
MARDSDLPPPRELALADPPLDSEDAVLPLEVEPPPLVEPPAPLLVPLTGDVTLVAAEPVPLPTAP